MTSGVNGSYTIEESNVNNVNINFNTTKMVSYSSGTTAVGGIVAGACFNQYKIKNCNVTQKIAKIMLIFTIYTYIKNNCIFTSAKL